MPTWAPWRQLGHLGHQLGHLGRQLDRLGRQLGHLGRQLGGNLAILGANLIIMGVNFANLGHLLPNLTDHLWLWLSLGVLKYSSIAPGQIKTSRCAKDATKLCAQLDVPCYVGYAASTNLACYTKNPTKLLVQLDVLCNVAV